MQFGHDGFLLVVIDDFDIKGVPGLPAEADAPLLTNADSVLARTLTGESLQPIGWGDPEVIEIV
jgi:hypothetical protein